MRRSISESVSTRATHQLAGRVTPTVSPAVAIVSRAGGNTVQRRPFSTTSMVLQFDRRSGGGGSSSTTMDDDDGSIFGIQQLFKKQTQSSAGASSSSQQSSTSSSSSPAHVSSFDASGDKLKSAFENQRETRRNEISNVFRSNTMGKASAASSSSVGGGVFRTLEGNGLTGSSDVSVSSGADAKSRAHNVFIDSRRARGMSTSGIDAELRSMRTERLFPMIPRLEGLQVNYNDVNTCQMIVIKHPDGKADFSAAEAYFHTLVGGGDGVPSSEREERVRHLIEAHTPLTNEILRNPDFSKTFSDNKFLIPLQLEPLPASDLKLIMKTICKLRGISYEPSPADPAPSLTSMQKFLASGKCPPASIADIADYYEQRASFQSPGFAFVVYAENCPSSAVMQILSMRFGIPMNALNVLHTTGKDSTAVVMAYVLPNYTRRENLLMTNVMTFSGQFIRIGNVTELPAELFGPESLSRISKWAHLWRTHRENHTELNAGRGESSPSALLGEDEVAEDHVPIADEEADHALAEEDEADAVVSASQRNSVAASSSGAEVDDYQLRVAADSKRPVTIVPGKVFSATTMLFRRVRGGSKEDVKQSLNWLKEVGAVNYSPTSASAMLVVRALLNDDSKAAVLRLLYDHSVPELLKNFFAHPTVANATDCLKLKLLPQKLTILKNVVVTHGDFDEVLRRLPAAQRRKLIYSAESFILNAAMSARLRLSSNKVLVGDFVLRRAGVAAKTEGEAEAGADFASVDEEDDFQSSRSRYNRDEVVLVTSEAEAALYSMADVVLPMRTLRMSDQTREGEFTSTFAPPNSPCIVNTHEWLVKFLIQHGLETVFALNTLSEACQGALQATSFNNSGGGGGGGTSSSRACRPCTYSRLIAIPYRMSFEIFEDDAEWRLDPEAVQAAASENRLALDSAYGEEGGAVLEAMAAKGQYATTGASLAEEADEEMAAFSAEGFSLLEEQSSNGSGNQGGNSASDLSKISGVGGMGSVLYLRGTTDPRLRLGEGSLTTSTSPSRLASVKTWEGRGMIGADSFRFLTNAAMMEELRRCGVDKYHGEIVNPTNAPLILSNASEAATPDTAAAHHGALFAQPSPLLTPLDALSTGIPVFPNASPLGNGLMLPMRSYFGLPEEDHLRRIAMGRADEAEGFAPGSKRIYRGSEAWKGQTTGSDHHDDSPANNKFLVWGSSKRRAERFAEAKPISKRVDRNTRHFTVKVTFLEPPMSAKYANLIAAYLSSAPVQTAEENVYQHDCHKNMLSASQGLLRSVAATTRIPEVFEAIVNELYSELSIDIRTARNGSGQQDQVEASLVYKRATDVYTQQRLREMLHRDLNAWRTDYSTIPPRYSTRLKRTACDICMLSDHTSSEHCAVFKFHKLRKREAKHAGDSNVDAQKSALLQKERQSLYLMQFAYGIPLANGGAADTVAQLKASEPQKQLAGANGPSNDADADTRPLSFPELQHRLQLLCRNLMPEDAVAEWTITIDRQDPSVPWGFFTNGVRLTRISGGEGGRKISVAVLKKEGDADEADGLLPSTVPPTTFLKELERSAWATSEHGLSPQSTMSIFTVSAVNALPVSDPESMITAVRNNIKVLDCEADPESRLQLTVLQHTVSMKASPSSLAHRAASSAPAAKSDASAAESDSATTAAAAGNNSSADNAAKTKINRQSKVPVDMQSRFSMHGEPLTIFLVRKKENRWGINVQGLRLLPFDHGPDCGYVAIHDHYKEALLVLRREYIHGTAGSAHVFYLPSASTHYTDVVYTVRGVGGAQIKTPADLRRFMAAAGRQALRLRMLLEQIRLPLITVRLEGSSGSESTSVNKRDKGRKKPAAASIPVGFTVSAESRIVSLSGEDSLFGKAVLQHAPQWCNLRPDFNSKVKSSYQSANSNDGDDDALDDDVVDEHTSFLANSLLADDDGFAKVRWRVESVNGVEDYNMNSLRDIIMELKAGHGVVELGLRMVTPIESP